MRLVVEMNPEIHDRYLENSSISQLACCLQGFLVFFGDLFAPRVWLSCQSIDSLEFERFVKSVKNGPEVDASQSFEISDSFLLHFLVMIFAIEVNVRIGIFPVFLEQIDSHDVLVFIIFIVRVFSQEPEQIGGLGSAWSAQRPLHLIGQFVFFA